MNHSINRTHNIAATEKQRAVAGAGFTLTELLVVIALSVLLLGLLFGPMIQSFNLVRKSQAITQAQDASRFALERMSRELGEAAYVFDNRNLPINFPLESPGSRRADEYNLVYPINPNTGASSPNVPVLGAKIDFIPAATNPFTGAAGEIQDPTTSGVVGGASLRFPLATGTRIIRYFVGLRRNLNAAGTAQEYYRNVYEFPRTDNPDLNPFTLYRAEFDANDPNLFNTTSSATYGSAVANSGGFNDSNFFYNTNAAANGRSYAQNWRDVSSPIIQAEKSDLIVWQKRGNKEYVAGAPIQIPVSFGAGVVAGDTATPGFLTNDVSDLAGSVPSLYTAKYGAWTLPYTLTIYRGATDNNLSDATSGALTIRVDALVNTPANLPETQMQIIGEPTGVFASTNAGNLRYCFTSAGKLFLTTPNFSCQIDPTRGRVETGLPPILGNSASFAPQMRRPGSSALVDIPTLASSQAFDDHAGDPVVSLYRINTRDHRAGLGTDPLNGNASIDNPSEGYIVPTNQGILTCGLFEQRYYEQTAPLGALANPGTAAGVSPFQIFAPTGLNTAGISLVAGSERVLGPSPSLIVNLVTYSRVNLLDTLLREVGVLNASNQFAAFSTGITRYYMESDLDGTHTNPRLQFDVFPDNLPAEQNAQGWSSPLRKAQKLTGLPATDGGAGGLQRELQITYLWQNNYARNINGEPIDASKRSVANENGVSASANGRAITPEPDVLKVDYSTRSIVNVTLGIRVYDANSGQPETIQVADRIVVRNLGR